MRSAVVTTIVVAVLLVSASLAQAPSSGAATDWPMYRHDPAGTGYSPLAQINRASVSRLARAWTYSLAGAPPAADAGRGRGGGGGVNSQATPVVVSGVMYLPTASRVVALDADTGKEVWSYQVADGAPSRRGVAYWAGDATVGPRIFFMTGRRLIALDARTGTVASTFGQGGQVDIGVPYNSVPGVFRSVVVVGANTPPGAIGGIGNARAYEIGRASCRERV